jgi:4a-hydroxytetrahydrobiopterin dehydratase
MAGRVEVTLYTREGCHLCDSAKGAIRAAESLYRLNIELREVDVDGDDDLHARFSYDVQVIYVGGTEAFRLRVVPRELAVVVRGGARPRSSLANEKCVPCRGAIPALHGDEMHALERELGEGWHVVGEHHLEREFQFPDFAQALAFTNRVGIVAEEEGHHPDIHLSWGRVRIEIWTHAVNGLTRSDFILAAKLNRLA